MAARAKSSGAKAPAASARRKTAARAAKKPTMASVEKERDQLQAKLKTSEARVAELERMLDEALNRIDWAIDSLKDAAANKN